MEHNHYAVIHELQCKTELEIYQMPKHIPLVEPDLHNKVSSADWHAAWRSNEEEYKRSMEKGNTDAALSVLLNTVEGLLAQPIGNGRQQGVSRQKQRQPRKAHRQSRHSMGYETLTQRQLNRQKRRRLQYERQPTP